jgi:hypothetical protein
MKLQRVSFLRRLFEDTHGQAMMFLQLCCSIFLVGFMGISLDLGRTYAAYQILQESTNAATLAAAAAMPNTSAAITNATAYSAMSGKLNSSPLLINASVGSGPSFECSTEVQNNLNIPCLTATGSVPGSFNAMYLTQTAQVPLMFGKFYGVPTISFSFTSYAAMRGVSAPFNVAVILDTTLSQNSTDDNCGTGVTELQCQLNGVLTLLQELYPCTYSSAKANGGNCVITNGVAASSVDRVAIFTFPAVTAGSASVDSNCTTMPTATGVAGLGGVQNTNANNIVTGWNNASSSFGYYSGEGSSKVGSSPGYYFQGASGSNTGAWATWPIGTAYPYPSSTATSYSPGTGTSATYEITLGLTNNGDANGFFSDYRLSPTATSLNTASKLVMAAGGKSSCGGIATPNYDGNIGTYYAGVIYAAQAAVTAEQVANPGSDNVIIILSDGNANSPSGTYSMSAGSSGTYPSYKGECGQAVVAAQYASGKGTTVYSIAYGSPTTSSSSNCPSDVNFGTTYKNITPCQTMQLMATGATATTQSPYFYSDYNQSGSGSTCTSTYNPITTSLSQIFAQIGMGLQRARLITTGT